MFSDLNNQSLNKIPTNNAKAYPSVNSPNDGGFNSEENLRWLTKAIANKPFIIGQTDDDVNIVFDGHGEGGNGVYTTSGFFSIDGYIGKIAQQSDISFDKETNSTAFTNNTQNIQRFVQGLTNQETENKIETELGYLLFEEYNPTSTGAVPETIKAAWQTAYENNTCVGYVWNVYTGDYKNSLDTSVSGKVSYIFQDGSKTTIDAISESLPSETADYIDWIENTLIEGQIIVNGKPFAIILSDSITIFYPLFFETTKRYNKAAREYLTSVNLSFTDIYGFTYFNAHNSSYNTCGSRSYPNTTCTLIDMNSNAPLAQLGFTDCKTTTYPSYLYDYANYLYTQDDSNKYVRKSVSNIDDASYVKTDFPQNIESIKVADISSNSTVFKKYTIGGQSNNLLDLIPNSHTEIPFIHNTMSYYCLNIVEENSHYRSYLYTTEDHSKIIPVAFMDSEGSLCPDGFIYTANNGSTEPNQGDPFVGVSTHYPVEGYLHFAKRYYLQHLKDIPVMNPDEDTIKSVTVAEMCANPDFARFYNEVFGEAISIYMHLSYCSIIDNVVAPSFSYSTDYQDIKSVGCGNKLFEEKSNYVTQDTNGFFTRQTYSFQNPLNQNENEPINTTISYHNDLTSDTCKFQSIVVGVDDYEDGLITYSTTPDLENKKISMTEDPIYFIRYCTSGSSKIVDGFNLYYINSSNRLSIINKITGSTKTDSETGVTYYVRYLKVDDYLMPDKGSATINPPTTDEYKLYSVTGTKAMVSLSTPALVNSMINGLYLFWPVNTWVVGIPYTLHVRKDNLNYLRNIAIDDPGYYYGFEFDYKLEKDITNDDLFIAYLNIATTQRIGNFDIETSYNVYDTLSKKSKHRRESYIHFNKLYGDNYETLEDYILMIMKITIDGLQDQITALDDKVDELQTEVTNIKNTSIVGWGRCGTDVFYYVYGNGDTFLVGSDATYDYGGTDSQSPVYNNLNLKNVSIQSGITTIGDRLFMECTNIESVSIPMSVTTIGASAFHMNDAGTGATGKLESITIPSNNDTAHPRGVDTIKFGAFWGTALRSITVPSTVSTVGSYVFRECTDLETVVYNSSTISDYMFVSCTSLTSFTISSNLTSIGEYSFVRCTSLDTITYQNTLSAWESITKETNWDGKSGITPSGLTKIQCTDGYMSWDSANNEWIEVPNT